MGLGELGDPGATAGVTSSTPPVVAAPLTRIWASCALSTASWFISANCRAAMPFPFSVPMRALSLRICARS